MSYLLDANTISYVFGPRVNLNVSNRFYARLDDVAVASVVWSELVYGMERLPASRRKEELNDFLEIVIRRACPILPYDEAAAAWHARECARLERAGRTAPFVDSQIAAVAATNDLTLVTANLRDFANFQGLRVEDWSVPAQR